MFRIDHYLGKETVQNILALRFANQLFEPIWNANYVDHVQITMAEDIGIGGRAGLLRGHRRGTRRDPEPLAAAARVDRDGGAGLVRTGGSARREGARCCRATRCRRAVEETTARGQYVGGWQGGKRVLGLHEEQGFPKDSTTETYAAVTLRDRHRRWAGVPFYLRTGKRLGRRVTEVAVSSSGLRTCRSTTTATEELGENALVIRVQPDEGVTLRFGSKVPGTTMEVRDVTMDFGYGHAFTESSPEAYERLILDVLFGEPSLFPGNEEVELSWQILDPILKHWATLGPPGAVRTGFVGAAVGGGDDATHGPPLEASVTEDGLPIADADRVRASRTTPQASVTEIGLPVVDADRGGPLLRLARQVRVGRVSRTTPQASESRGGSPGADRHRRLR